MTTEFGWYTVRLVDGFKVTQNPKTGYAGCRMTVVGFEVDETYYSVTRLDGETLRDVIWRARAYRHLIEQDIDPDEAYNYLKALAGLKLKHNLRPTSYLHVA